MKPCGIKWGKRRKWRKLSTSWNLPGRSRRALFRRCDSNISCGSVTAQDAEPIITFPDYARPLPLTEGTK